MKIDNQDLSWLNETIEKYAQSISDKKPNGWFSIASISKVPYIPYPILTKDECLELQTQAMDVLRTSIRQNNYKEVSITYDLNSNSPDKYIITNGEIGYVRLMDDEKVKNLLSDCNEKKELAVISLHNHPNDSFFSINDLITFAENPCIKIMEIINTRGEIAFLLRPKFEIYHCVIETVLNAEPNYVEKKNKFQIEHDRLPKISDIITDFDVRKEIVKMSVSLLEDRDVCVQNYVNNENVRNVDFSKVKNIESSNPNKSDDVNTLPQDYEFEYLENGEDGYEWEER